MIFLRFLSGGGFWGLGTSCVPALTGPLGTDHWEIRVSVHICAQCIREPGRRADRVEVVVAGLAPGDPADNDANAQKIVDELKDATNPAVYFGIQASDCAEYIKALNKAGFTGQIVASGSCNDQSVLDLPETTGVIFEQQSYIEEQPTLYNEFVQREIASRKAAFDAYGPKSPGSAFLRTSFAAVVFAFQVMEDVIAAGGDPTDHATLQAALLAVNDQHIVGHPPISCGDNAPQFISVCKKSNTFTTWDGTTFVPYPGLEGKYLDLTQLLTDIPPRA